MLTATVKDWQASSVAEPSHQDFLDANEQAYFDFLAQQEEERRYPYGRPQQDTGWYWELPTWGTK